MPDKPKTYPQQILELKTQLEDAKTNEADALRQASFIPELQQEIDTLKGQLEAVSKEDLSAGALRQAQQTDLQQQIDSNVELARQSALVNQRLTAENQQLLNRLDAIGDTDVRLNQKDADIESLKHALMEANTVLIQRQQQFRDAMADTDTALESQSRELQTLRMAKVTSDRILFEVRSALNDAPDVIGSLKYIVGINGPGTE